MSDFNQNIAFLVPQALWSVAGEIIACISGQASDLGALNSARYQPDHAACNAQATTTHAAILRAVAAKQMQLPMRDFSTDPQAIHAACDSAQYVLDGIPEGGIVPQPGCIIIGLNVTAEELADACGLERVPEPVDE